MSPVLQRVRGATRSSGGGILGEADRPSAEGRAAPPRPGGRAGYRRDDRSERDLPSVHRASNLPGHRPRAPGGAGGDHVGPEFKRRLLGEDPRQVSGAGSSVPPLVDYFLANPEAVGRGSFTMDESFDYEPDPSTSLLARAMGSGRPLLELIYDELLGDDGRRCSTSRSTTTPPATWTRSARCSDTPSRSAVSRTEARTSGTICDASFPTYLLSHWARDRAVRRGRAGLETREVVHMLTAKNAAYMGLSDRGKVAPACARPRRRQSFRAAPVPTPNRGGPARRRQAAAAGRQRISRHPRGGTARGGARRADAGARPGRLIRAGQRR